MNTVTMKGNKLELTGNLPPTGSRAPDFSLVDGDLSPVRLSDFSGKTLIISVTPSLDTPVCDMQARRFNEEAARLSNVTVLNVSMDLPFAIKRFCTSNGIENAMILSDHRSADFGKGYGVLIKDLRLLARAVFVVSADGKVVYSQLVPEITELPDYEEALKAAGGLVAETAG